MEAGRQEIRRAGAKCWPHFAAAAAFSFVINLLYLALPLYMLQVYDRVLSSGSVPTLVMLTVACLIALAALAALDVVRTEVLMRTGLRLDRLLSARIIVATVNRASEATSERGQSLRDLDVLRHVVSGGAMQALFDAPWTPVYIGLIFLIHPLLGGVSILCAAVLLTLAVLNELMTRRILSASEAHATRNHVTIDAGLRNAEVIQVLGMLGDVTRRWLEERRPVLALGAMASVRTARVIGLIKFFRLFVQALVLALGAYLVIEQSLTGGAMFAAVIILGRALQPVEQLVSAWRPLIAARNAVGRLARLLDANPPVPKRLALPRPRGDLSVQGVDCLVDGVQRPALINISFALAPGETLGIIGPTAAGKSTLARIITGFRRPTSGIVRLDGADLASWNRDDLGRYLGYLPQDVELFAGTVAENISRFAPASEELILAAAQGAGTHELILGLPDGYETEVGESGSRLSGGQRQRIALARALYGNPSLVVLDEPNSNLDGEGESALATCLNRLKEAGATVVVVSHRISALRQVDKVLHLQEGRILAFGPREQVLEKLRVALHGQRAQAAAARAAPY